MPDAKGWHSRGYLPHFDSPGTVQHVVFRTRDSLPSVVMDAFPGEIAARRRAAGAFLDRLEHGNVLADPEVAAIAQAALLHFDGTRYNLLAWCVMPNHVHVAVRQSEGWPLGGLVKSWKMFAAVKINIATGNRGPVWVPDYFDRFIRNHDHLAATIDYVESNPVRSGLAATPQDWFFSSASRKP